MVSTVVLALLMGGISLAQQSQAPATPTVISLNPDNVITLFNQAIAWGQKVGIAAGALAIMIAGFQALMAWGNTRSIQGAMESVKWAVLGLVLILGCYIIPSLLQGAANSAPAA